MQPNLAQRGRSAEGTGPATFPYAGSDAATPWPGIPGAEACPDCGAAAANVQGLLDCPDCEWTDGADAA